MLTIISKEQINGLHPIEAQSSRTSVWLDGYIVAPEHLTNKVWETCGYCDLIIDENGELVDITPTERPTPELPTPTPTTDERITTLEADNAALTQQLTDTQLALCDVYEALMAVTPTEEGEAL